MTKAKVNLTPASDASQAEKLGWEKELLGLYISEHPFNDYKKLLAGLITPIAELKKCTRDASVTVGGVVSSIKKIITRSNETMLFVKIEDQAANVEVLVFPSLLKMTGEIWQAGKVVLCHGRLSDKDQEIKLLLGKAVELPLVNISEAIERFKNTKETGGRGANGNSYGNSYGKGNGHRGYTSVKKVVPTAAPPAALASLKIIFNEELKPEALASLKELLVKNTGNDKVYFKIFSPGGAQVIETGFRVKKNQELVEAVRKLGGGTITVLDN